MRWSLVCVIGLGLSATDRAAADVDSYHVYSLEWLVDASQSVQLATVVRENNPATGGARTRIKRLERVLKGAGDKSKLTDADLSAAVLADGENRVLLFLRPDPRKTTPQILYVVYLTKHVVPSGSLGLPVAITGWSWYDERPLAPRRPPCPAARRTRFAN